MRAGGHQKSTSPKLELKVGISITLLSADPVRYHRDGMVESAWTPLPIAVTSSLESTQDKSKIELCTYTCQPLVS